MTSIALTGTNHTEDQPSHLKVETLTEYLQEVYGDGGAGDAATREKSLDATRREHVKVNVGQYAGLLGHACPAGVYEYIDDEASWLSFYIRRSS
jgi:electron-transferring-flavoprotein dehydrogenase